jgi:adenine-specific DNA-methyltransferase
MDYKKVPQQINDVVGDNVKKLAQIFPSAVKDGEVDFKALKEELGQFKEVGAEKYELTWAGKQKAKKLAQEDVFGRTLNFIPEESKNADITENLYIEGENLEVLKLLRQNYYGAIKMIYIDPPYNTGNDFVYKDSYVVSQRESDLQEGVIGNDGERFSINTKSQNRYHACWLNELYPRLVIAKDLLKDTGVLFISIDDNEQSNLKLITDEIFGIDNFVTTLHIELSATQGMKVKAAQNGNIVKNAEYILVYCKNGRKDIASTILYDYRPVYDGHYSKMIKNNKLCNLKDEFVKAFPNESISNITDAYRENNVFREYVESNIDNIFADDKISGYDMSDYIEGKVYCVNSENRQYYIYNNGKKMRQLLPLAASYGQCDDFENSFGLRKIRGDWWKEFYKDMGNVSKEGDVVFANGKKPVRLIKQLCKMCTDKDDIILDFFSGSATTAHAVMDLNKDDNGKRKFIMVQIRSNVELESEFETICEIGKERIRRAADKIKQEHPDADIDTGFKVFRVADSNIKWNSLSNLGQLNIDLLETNPDQMDFMPNAKDVDIVYELMLRQRDVSLSEILETLSDIGSRTYLYASSFLVCLETEITTQLVEKIAKIDPLPIKFIFRDSAFKDDIALKDETFRRLKALVEKNSGTNKPAYTVEFI